MAAIAEPAGYPAQVERAGPLRWATTVDHKDIGVLYLVTTAVFFMLGGLQALLMRVQLAAPRMQVLGPDAYNALFTMHGTTMIFLVVMPMLLGFANYLVPLMIGARDMAFPRLNALSYWLLLFGGLLLYYSFLAGSPPDVGWFAYAPLNERPFTGTGVEYWIAGLLVTSVGSIATGLNLVVTVVKLRAPGMTAFRMPVFVWMSLITALLILWAVPSLSAAQVMLLLDRLVGTHFFDVRAGADALLWQHLFWFFGHPEVYIMALPAFGIISEVIPVFSRKPLFGYSFVVASGMAIAFLSMGVWGHHMFAAGMGFVDDALFGASSLLIAVPTGVKVFNWLATMWGGRLRLTTAMLYAMSFIAMFTIGGITGVHFAMVPIDWQTTDSYYVVAHFHYVLFGGSALAILAGTYYWFPKMTGRLLDERLGKWNFWLTFISFNLLFFPMHVLGLLGMPRRVYTYPDLPWWGPLNLLETAATFVMAVAIVILLWNMWASLRRGHPSGPNPWGAWTLEWATPSPPPPYNFATLPPIVSNRPLLRDERGAGTQTAPSAVVADAGSWIERVSLSTMGMLTFITSEVVFFGALIFTYIEYQTRSAGPGPGVLDVRRTALFSLALFASSGTAVMAERRLRRDDGTGFRLWLVGTIVLGAIFLYGQGSEYLRLIGQGVVPNLNLFTSAFYTLTGFHGLHVTLGLLMLLALAITAFAGGIGPRSSPGRHTAVGAVSIYWHFVDAVWAVILTVVYLWNLL